MDADQAQSPPKTVLYYYRSIFSHLMNPHRYLVPIDLVYARLSISEAPTRSSITLNILPLCQKSRKPSRNWGFSTRTLSTESEQMCPETSIYMGKRSLKQNLMIRSTYLPLTLIWQTSIMNPANGRVSNGQRRRYGRPKKRSGCTRWEPPHWRRFPSGNQICF